MTTSNESPGPGAARGPTVLAREPITIVSSDGVLYYLTDCCRASGKGSIAQGIPCVTCRNCYREVDSIFGDGWRVDDAAGWDRYRRVLLTRDIAAADAQKKVAEVRASAQEGPNRP